MGNLFLVKVSRPVWMNNLSRKLKRLVSIATEKIADWFIFLFQFKDHLKLIPNVLLQQLPQRSRGLQKRLHRS